MFGLYGNGTASFVFVKTLKEKATNQEQHEFQNELNMMTDIRHQHILTLLAMSMKGSSQCLLYEYLPLGNLNQFLLSQEAHGSSLQHKEVMYILTQIASALEYLTSHQFVHKDVAARNVMVSHNLNVKLSNLKMAYGLHSGDYCLLHGNMIAVRWSPPETITYGQFTLETDIYSYGVLMWEVFSGGKQPYVGIHNDDVIEMIRSRQLLACPAICPPRIYSLMMECWHETASKRPSAKEVHQKLRAWYLDNSNPYTHSTTSAPSVSNSSVHSHHSSSAPTYPSSGQARLTDIRVADGKSASPIPKQPQFNKLHATPSKGGDKPPFYNSLYPDSQQMRHYPTDTQCTDDVCSSSLSESTAERDDESEFSMPVPNNRLPLGNPYSSLNRRPKINQLDYRPQMQPFLPIDQV